MISSAKMNGLRKNRPFYLKISRNKVANGLHFAKYYLAGTTVADFRSDNNIKNHFYSMLRNIVRRILKLMGEKNGTSQMRKIKPSALSAILRYSDTSMDLISP